MRHSTTLVCIILMAAVAACDSFFAAEVDAEPPDPAPRLVVHSMFTPDSIWAVIVTRTARPYEVSRGGRPVPYVDNATVEILEGGRVLDTLRFVSKLCHDRFDGDECYSFRTYKSPPHYRSVSGLRPEPGVTYGLRVSAPGLPTITAEGAAPAQPPAAEARVVEQWSEPDGGLRNFMAKISVALTDPPDESNYYFLTMEDSGYGSSLGRTAGQEFYTSDPILVESARSSYDVELDGDRIFYTYFDDALLNGRAHTFTLTVNVGWSSGSRTVIHSRGPYMASVSHALYLYQSTYSLHREVQRNPFAEPVEVYSNVEGGYGIFAGYTGQGYPPEPAP